MRKENQVNQTTATLDLDNIFNWQKEKDCFKGKFIGQKLKNGKQAEFPREKPIAQFRYENWLSKISNPMDPDEPYYTNGEGTGRCLGKEGPKRIITSIVRVRTKDKKQYLVSYGRLIGYSQYGDPIQTPCDLPEIWTKVNFGVEVVPNLQKGTLERRTTAPIGNETKYEVEFNKENLEKLTALRESDNNISFAVKDEISNKTVQVKNQKTIEDTIKLFLENDFDYLFNASYLGPEELEKIRIRAMNEGLIKRESIEDLRTNIYNQQNLTKQKQIAIQ